jgi:DNA-binding IclR family transcriptional regulator
MCVFSVKQGNYGYFAALTNDSFGVRQDAPLGTRYYLHENSGGKAILAELPDDQIDSVIQEVGLPKQTENTITSRSELFDRIEKIRERGFAMNTEERRKGINAVAVSIHDSEIGDYGALTVAGPANRLNEQKLEKHGETLLGAINELELEINYS